MARITLKQSSAVAAAGSAAQPDVRGFIREAVRVAASFAPVEPPLPSAAPVRAAGSVLCMEQVDGRVWRYEVEGGGRSAPPATVRAVPLQAGIDPLEHVASFVRSCIVPDGFPDSVIPSYVPYMSWRALQHFFGGAIGVFTTQTLLSSVGVARSRAGAVAINWIIKDGAGRIGKMLFARQGKKFDYDLKQLRFAGDLLMEVGAAVELATALAPQFFLPLACAANVSKNVAVVTATATRTPIYKAYAKGENIGDVTAKGECIGNVADLLGTSLGILLSKQNPPLAATFAFLSTGYLIGSYLEVKSVVLNTLNRARFKVAVDSFIQNGHIPSLDEGNSMEKIFTPPWVKNTPVVIGPRFGEAFQDPSSYSAVKPLFQDEKYLVTYNPSKDKIYALLKDHAKSEDILKAAFHAHVLLHFIRSSNGADNSGKFMSDSDGSINSGASRHRSTDFLPQIAESCNAVSSKYETFRNKASAQGWIMSDSLLNPGRARLC